ncbi:AAA family ATPase [Pseudomonas beijingensis]|uniref:UvrD-helicase domain-containing protein n=1 Tax=Pseudomonas beijingensis TaxID=2954101 RepID=UPI002734CD36|nr:UvrD-helicase domain-containing protein [Pseudomonas sp. FP830]WLI47078.1 AAA family ATPase [Pseudomonas sp. FP830]
MDKRVIFAVAGSGKTTLLVNRLSLEKRALIVTYTENNYRHLRDSIIKRFGHVPKNINVLSYFTFLHSFCYRPLLQMRLETRGISFRMPHPRTLKIKRDDMAYYTNKSGNLYHNRLAKLVEIEGAIPDVIARIERFYDEFYVDEVQDLAGHDFNLMMALAKAKIEIMFVGDFYQHTFDTSRDGNVNSSLHVDIGKYEKHFQKAGITVDKETLSRSWRCGVTVCDFIRAHLQIDIQSQHTYETEIIPLTNQADANTVHADASVVKLFYKEHYKYGCVSNNWGACKGLDNYNDVCVVLGNSHWKIYENSSLDALPPQTKNKLYVAFSRARGRLYLVPEKLFKTFKAV